MTVRTGKIYQTFLQKNFLEIGRSKKFRRKFFSISSFPCFFIFFILLTVRSHVAHRSPIPKGFPREFGFGEQHWTALEDSKKYWPFWGPSRPFGPKLSIPPLYVPHRHHKCIPEFVVRFWSKNNLLKIGVCGPRLWARKKLRLFAKSQMSRPLAPQPLRFRFWIFFQYFGIFLLFRVI